MYPTELRGHDLFYRCGASRDAGFISAKREIDRILLTIRLGSHRFRRGGEQLANASD